LLLVYSSRLVTHENSNNNNNNNSHIAIMVKKKGKSKRTTLQDKYKIQRRIVDTKRKRNKQAKRDLASSVVRHSNKSKKDPGIPNSWPFKQDLLQEIQRTRQRDASTQKSLRDKRAAELRALRQHQEQGGTAQTVQELLEQAQQDQQAFAFKSGVATSSSANVDGDDINKKDTLAATPAGQQSRRAYMRELKKVVDTADVLLQVLDARDPLGSRIHPSVEGAILSKANKKLVLVLNKIDLVPRDVVRDWLLYLRRSHPCIAIKASHKSTAPDAVHDNDTKGDDGSTAAASASTMSTTTPVGMEGLLQLLKNYARTSGPGGGADNKTTVVVGIIGYPNVGKSSSKLYTHSCSTYLVFLFSLRFFTHILAILVHSLRTLHTLYSYQCSQTQSTCRGRVAQTRLYHVYARSCLGSQHSSTRQSWRCV
jgi:nuclear GTP-binding protein